MTDIEIVKKAVNTLNDKKAADIKVLKVGDLTLLANYFILATGTSSTQVKALADEVDFRLASEDHLEPHNREGYQSGNWIVLDYIDVIVHIFHTETREFYDLERLWADGEVINIEEFLK